MLLQHAQHAIGDSAQHRNQGTCGSAARMHHARGYTLAGMTEKPTGRAPSQRAGARAGEDRPDQEEGPGERYGLLVVARHVKDDGRALIIYTRAQGLPE
jgi:hypothetical protein